MINKLRKLEKQGYITLRSNGDNLLIANYTNRVQYEGLWNDHELITQCRGLIVDDKGNVVKRPFEKFFNIEEYSEDDIPDESFTVSEKMDGTLNILYYDYGKDMYRMASRGSFDSWHSYKGTELLHEKYSDYIHQFDDSKTYLFELIHPENMIVVKYSGEKKLVLLAVIDTETGQECSIDEIEWPDKVQTYSDVDDIYQLMEMDEENREGFVVRFSSGFRVKVKFEWYKRVHKMVSGIHTKAIWEHLSEGRDFEEMLSRVPDEFYQWVIRKRDEFIYQFNRIKGQCEELFRQAPSYENRKEFALWAKEQEYPHVLFSMLDGDEEKTEQQIWKQIKPEKAEFFCNE